MAADMRRAGEVLLFVVDAGGGHRAAARALLAAAEETGFPLRLRAVSLQEVLAPQDVLKRFFGLSIEDFYNLLLRRRFTVLLEPLLRLLHRLIALRRRALVRGLVPFLRDAAPRAVVSVIPNFNGVIRDALREAVPGAPFLVLLTDLADLPPHFWIEPGVDGVIVGTDEAALQARALGLPEERIHRVSGMPLHPRFYAGPGNGGDVRARVRSELGVPAGAFTAMLLFGGKGSAEIESLTRDLLGADQALHVIAVCGDNPRLLEGLRPLGAAARGRLHALGFTDRIADYMAASDVLVTKPGPGSLAEAFQKGLPVVVAENRDTIPMERFNARFVAEKGLGTVVGAWSEAPAAVVALARDGDRRAQVARNLRELPANRAVYEALRIVEAAAASGAEPAPAPKPVITSPASPRCL
ncbi:MAG TPA: glycosyltransferase [Vicinamibacteria bacterium]